MIDDAARSCLDSLPHAFLCVTSLCNYKCFYCQPGGECHSRSHVSMDEATASLVVRALAEIGIGRLRITGGEPTLMPWLGDMLLGARDGGFDKIRLSTNGARLLDVLPQVQSSRARVQLSLDTLDPQLFREITRGGDLGAVLRVADALASKSIPTRVNTVLLRSSMGGFPQLLEFCRCRGFSMKVLGL